MSSTTTATETEQAAEQADASENPGTEDAVQENAQQEAQDDAKAQQQTDDADAGSDSESSESEDASQASTATVQDESAEKAQDKASTGADAGAVNSLALATTNINGSKDFSVKVRAVTETNCVGCHQSGVDGAQRLDDTVAWSKLADKGIDALTASVINGVGGMPARAETSLSDEELRESVKYLLYKVSGSESDASASGAATETEGSDAEVTSETDAEQPADDSESQADASQEKPEAGDQTDAAAADTTTESAGATAEASEEAQPAVAVTEFPANVKNTTDTICASCHLTGVANAPKYGDKAAWDERLANGMDALVASAIAGKGAMPPRGASTLTDDEVKLAIQYILTK